MLGDCLSLPPSWAQPVLYETIPRALASSIGRGQGSLADDIYAFGVTLAVLLRVNDPLAKMSDEEIIRCKIEHSSYIALTGKDRFKGSLLELLRGVLHDQENERWTIDDIMIWLDGRRLSPKQVTRPKKASRALTFMGRKYFFLPFLLADMQAEPSEAVKILENGEMDQWIQRCLENEEAAEEVRLAISHSMTDNKAPGYEHKLMARLRPLLDENAPVQYKNLRLRPDGFGRALAQDLIQKKDPSPFIELVRESTVLSWISARRDKNLDVGALVPKFESCRNFIRNTKIGFGLERCLYELCPEAHCLSDKFTNYLVHNAEEMIRILEKLCKENKAKPLFLDRHSVAFLSVVDPKTIDPFLHDLGTPEKYKYILGNLKCLAAIQKRYDMEPFPSISKAFIEFLAPVYERFHDRVMQQKVKKDVEQFAETGSLIKMLNALANSEIISRDYSSFQAAGAEYAFLLSEEKSLTRELQDRNTFARATGRRISAGIAIAIAIIVISFVSFAFFVNKAPLF
ncbi:MAG: hypothetical protein K9G62_01045 [Alphaproteobacteria bacterium]|nr:hypothetical protein [Alphaproteobacteria bacterium]